MYKVVEKKKMAGHNVSHANNKTKRFFNVKKQKISFYSFALKRKISFVATQDFRRLVNKFHGIDNMLLKCDKKHLNADLMKLKAIVSKRLSQDTDQLVKDNI